jgi:dTDP-L-rhamnose 4-epimerase
LLANEAHQVEKIIVASSMSIYGEGAYICNQDGEVYPRLRSEEHLARREWDVRCPKCRQPVESTLTPEEKPLFPTSIYAISKMDQELMCLAVGQAYGIPVVALRYFNTYGPRQALSNPYTGVPAIFSSRLLNGRPPIVFEDGHQGRDFINVTDVARANILALESDRANGQVLNIGTGRLTTVIEVAHTLAERLGVDLEPEVVGKYRAGDIRHCYADISKARELLGFEAEVRFKDGMGGLVDWIREQEAIDRVDSARAELERRGLTR